MESCANLAVAVGSLSATEALNNVDEAAVVLHASLGASSLLLLLLLRLDLKKGKINACKYARKKKLIIVCSVFTFGV